MGGFAPREYLLAVFLQKLPIFDGTTRPKFRSYITSTTDRRATKLPQFEEHMYRSQIQLQGL